MKTYPGPYQAVKNGLKCVSSVSVDFWIDQNGDLYQRVLVEPKTPAACPNELLFAAGQAIRLTLETEHREPGAAEVVKN